MFDDRNNQYRNYRSDAVRQNGIDSFTSDMIRVREKTMSDPLRRRNSVGLDSIAGGVLAEMHLLEGLRRQTVFNVWKKLSGAEAYTAGLAFKDGILYVTMASSVIRTQLSFQTDWIRSAINRELATDKVFVSLYGGSPDEPVKKIVLR